MEKSVFVSKKKKKKTLNQIIRKSEKNEIKIMFIKLSLVSLMIWTKAALCY